MYRMAWRGWIKHLDFILLDMLSLLITLNIMFLVSRRLGRPFLGANPLGFVTMVLLIDLVIILAFDSFDTVVTRGYYVEFICTLRHDLLLLAFSVLAVLIRAEHLVYAKLLIAMAFLIYFGLSYGTRVIWKEILHHHFLPKETQRPILIVTDSAHAGEILERMRTFSFIRYKVIGLVLADRDAKGEEFDGVPVTANLSDAAEYLCREWVDEVLFFCTTLDARTQELLLQCREMALTIHVYVAIQGIDSRKQTIGNIAGYEVLTANVNLMDPKDAFLKRSFDIAAGAVGSVFALLLLAVLGPFLYAASPGPLIFCQERIGENGHKFKMYKIRSMYPDAEERKAALRAESTHGDGMMFKMDFDPRVIGNRILPDGTRKKGIGDFIRATSLDEFPQFFNVLKGDMSIVGTRPPTPDEWEQYQFHHRARMSVKPGMTGLWQIRPDKDYMSFDDVVKLDTEYISRWGIGLDLRIVLKTAGKFLRGMLPKHKKAAEENKAGAAR